MSTPSALVGPFAVEQAGILLDALKRRYPRAETALNYQNPWQLLVATALSAQTTDETVNRVSKELFATYPTAADLARANPEDVERIVFSTGYYRQKAAAIIELSADLVARFGGEVPHSLDDLVTLKGVGRKTASVVLAEAFGLPAIAVDTHVKRVSSRLGLTSNQDPFKIEFDLRGLYPESEWSGISMRFISFGREVCDAKKPRCGECEMEPRCPWPGKVAPAGVNRAAATPNEGG